MTFRFLVPALAALAAVFLSRAAFATDAYTVDFTKTDAYRPETKSTLSCIDDATAPSYAARPCGNASNPVYVTGTLTVNTGSLATSAKQDTGNTSLATIATNSTTANTAQTPVAPATATATHGVLGACQYNSSGVTPTDGQQFSLQCGAKGGLSVGGTVGAGSADGGNPVKGGAVYNQSGSVPTYTTGNRTDNQAGVHGELKTCRVDSSGNCTDPTTPQPFYNAPSASASQSIVPVVSTALEACHVLDAAPGNLYRLSAVIQATSGVVQLFNATSAPSDGAVTPVWAQTLKSDGTYGSAEYNFSTMPLYFSVGITVCFSSATTPFTKTASATAMFSAEVK